MENFLVQASVGRLWCTLKFFKIEPWTGKCCRREASNLLKCILNNMFKSSETIFHVFSCEVSKFNLLVAWSGSGLILKDMAANSKNPWCSQSSKIFLRLLSVLCTALGNGPWRRNCSAQWGWRRYAPRWSLGVPWMTNCIEKNVSTTDSNKTYIWSIVITVSKEKYTTKVFSQLAPENGWLEDYCPFWEGNFSAAMLCNQLL